MLMTENKKPLELYNYYKNKSCFLICGGPSFAKVDHSLLRQPGILTMAVNNAVKSFRPNLWVSVDDPSHFIRSIFFDPLITKFVYLGNRNKFVFNSDEWEFTNTKVSSCPNVIYYERNDHFQPDKFLIDSNVNWGNHALRCSYCYCMLPNHVAISKKQAKKPTHCTNCKAKWDGGGRSVMLVAIRILYHIGIRNVYLLGADFTMSPDNKYHFDQDRAKGSIRGNNDSYEKLQRWFTALRPYLEAKKMHVYNCNPESKLTAFDKVSVDVAVKDVVCGEFGMDKEDLEHERTSGLYDRAANDRKKTKDRKVEIKTDGKWESIRFKRLRVGNLFRMFEPDGTPVTDLGVTEWIVKSKPIKQNDQWIVTKSKPNDKKEVVGA